VQLLIANGTHLNHQAHDGSTALMVASQYDQTQNVVNLLLKAGANPNLRDCNGHTALMLALLYCNIHNIAKDLIKKTNLFIKDPQGHSIIEYLLKLPPQNIFFLLEDNYCAPISGDYSCSICLEGNNLLQLHCSHIYHSVCIQKWLESSNTCPMCRNSIV
jgi:ankyrin repeat protein